MSSGQNNTKTFLFSLLPFNAVFFSLISKFTFFSFLSCRLFSLYPLETLVLSTFRWKNCFQRTLLHNFFFPIIYATGFIFYILSSIHLDSSRHSIVNMLLDCFGWSAYSPISSLRSNSLPNLLHEFPVCVYLFITFSLSLSIFPYTHVLTI